MLSYRYNDHAKNNTESPKDGNTLDKSQLLLEIEIEQLRSRIESEPEKVLAQAEQCLIRARQLQSTNAIVETLMIISLCHWCQMDYRAGLKSIKDAYHSLSNLETDHFLPEVLHIHALQYWGQAKYYSAQQYWINALEQSALIDNPTVEIECLIGLGNIWRITGEYKLACSTHELAVKVANNYRISWLEGKARILLAWDFYHLHQYIDMLTILDGAEEALQHNNNLTWKAEVWDFRGLALLGLERIEDAEEATRKAHQLAVANNLTWIKAHSFISRARIELLRKNFSAAGELLNNAEKAASSFDNGELLSQICYQQSRVAEENGDIHAALLAFKKYRRYTAMMLREQTLRVGLDKSRSSKRQLEQRARKLINRIRGQHEFDPEKHLSNVVSETYWWEQLVLFKTELKKSNYAVVVIQHPNPKYIDVCTEVIHFLCAPQDLLSRISSDRLGLLLAEKGDSALQMFQVMAKMIEIYPWRRRGLEDKLPKIMLQDILSFPFTLEQLIDSQAQEKSHGSPA